MSMGGEGFGGLFGQIGLPAPQAVLAELQRLNRNLEALMGRLDTLERVTPALEHLSQSMDGIKAQDLRALATSLKEAKLPHAVRTLEAFYTKIWGRPPGPPPRAG